jgi:carboxylesterase type B
MNITIYGESHGSVLVNALVHSSIPAPLPFSRAIMQSSQLGMPISTPQPLSYQNAIYESIKRSLGASTLSELQAVEFEKLLEAYKKCDPSASVQAGLVLDGNFLHDKFQENFSFKGNIMIGTNGAEETVLRMVCAWHLRVVPPPALSNLIPTLSSFLRAEIIRGILMAYGIDETTGKEELVDKLLKIAADVVFYKPAHDHVSRWEKERGEMGGVQQYIFEQHQPFTGPFKGKAAHSLDLAYLHGNPEIFSSTENPEMERDLQRGVQNAWIHFANGELEWGGKEALVRRFGPNEVVDEEREIVLGRWRRGTQWMVLEGLTGEQETKLMGMILIFVGELIGLEIA